MLDYRAEDEIESTTIGGLIMEWLGRVPKAGEKIERDGIAAEVLASDGMRIAQVRLTRAPKATA
jgi:CBS domain containing-hemolysin-like protein